MKKMMDVIIKAVMLISIDDDLELNQLLMQYIMIEEFLSDDLKIDWYDDDVTTSQTDFISSKRSVSDNQVDEKNIRHQNTEMLHDLEERELDYEERRLNILHKLLQTMKEHNRIQKERNNILKSFIEICEIAPFVDEETEICIDI